MKKRRFIEDNKGYTLVELIIVMAIIVALTGMSMVTLTLMHSAKAKEASVTFESEISSLASNARSKSYTIPGSTKDYLPCIMIYQSGNTTYIKRGYYIIGEDVTMDTSYEFIDSENNNDGKGLSLSTYVYVQYKAIGQSDATKLDSSKAFNKVYIVYDKKGNCISGTGEYSFYKKNGSNIAQVTLNKNGSHQIN